MVHDLVIKNGTVVDGTGGAAFAADVAVDGEKISAIGTNLGSGKKEIDAKGHVVASGFIDSHTHMDAFVVQYPNGNPVVITLFTHVGSTGSQANFQGTIFDDPPNATTPIQNGGPPFNGRFIPQFSLNSALAGL